MQAISAGLESVWASSWLFAPPRGQCTVGEVDARLVQRPSRAQDDLDDAGAPTHWKSRSLSERDGDVSDGDEAEKGSAQYELEPPLAHRLEAALLGVFAAPRGIQLGGGGAPHAKHSGGARAPSSLFLEHGADGDGGTAGDLAHSRGVSSWPLSESVRGAYAALLGRAATLARVWFRWLRYGDADVGRDADVVYRAAGDALFDALFGVPPSSSTALSSTKSAPPFAQRLAWHWAQRRLAVVCSGDHNTIHVLHIDSGGDDGDRREAPRWQRPALRSSRVSGINALAYRPYAGDTLAAGSDGGVAVWRRGKVSCLRRAAHLRVTSVEWSTDGALLASVSPVDGLVVLWDASAGRSGDGVGGNFAALRVVDVASAAAAPFARSPSALAEATPLVRWAPEPGTLLYASCSRRGRFRMWDTEQWWSSEWSELAGAPTAACWSHDASALLVAPAGEAVVHALRFDAKVRTPPAGNVAASRAEADPAARARVVHSQYTAPVHIPVGDFSSAGVPSPSQEREGESIGGVVDGMAWDSAQERLAVAFKPSAKDGDGGGEPLLALFATRLRPAFRMTPVGALRGPSGCGRAVSLAFQPHLPRHGGRQPQRSLLAVAWESGVVSFVQIANAVSAGDTVT